MARAEIEMPEWTLPATAVIIGIVVAICGLSGFLLLVMTGWLALDGALAASFIFGVGATLAAYHGLRWALRK